MKGEKDGTFLNKNYLSYGGDNVQYLSQIIQDEELSSIQPGLFNVLKAPRGIGKTTFMFDERILSYARDKKHVLYLIHNKVSRDAIIHNHSDKAKIFNDNNCNGWFAHRRKGLWTSEEDENYVHVMCYQTFAALLRNEGIDWLEDIDLIVWDEFDDIRKYFMKEVNDLKKQLPDFSIDKITALLEMGNDKSVVAFVYKIKNLILDPAKITLLAISATPELAANLFADYLNYILKGKIEEVYDAKKTLYIESVANTLKNKEIVADGEHKFWCYTKYINDILRIELLARQCGFNVLSLWSRDNPKYKELWTPDKSEAIQLIQKEGLIPPQYDFVIVNDVIGRAIDIVDTDFQDWLCNSQDYEDIGQFIRARFEPERKYLLNETKQLVSFVQEGIPSVYYDWHSLPELRMLIVEQPLYKEDGKPFKSWNEARKYYLEQNKIEERKFGADKIKQYRFIGGII